MFHIIEFFILLIYFIFRLYYLVDKKYIFSINGGKLKKYMISENQQNIVCSFVNAIKKNSIKNFFQYIKPPDVEIIKRFFIINLISFTFILLKTCIHYSFFASNFLYINILNKNIDIVSLFGENISKIKLIYIFLYSIAIYDLVYNFYYNIYKKITFNKLNTKEKIKEIPYITFYNDCNKNIVINKYGLFQNILITGSIGSGKTSSAISNIFLQLFNMNIGGLLIDVKGNYINTIYKMLNNKKQKERIIEISLDSKYSYNPLKSNVSNFEMASRLKNILLVISGNNNNTDSYWLDKAESYIRDFLTLMNIYTTNPNFYELHMLVISKEYLCEKLNLVKQKILSYEYSDEKLFNVNSAISNIKNEFLKLDERTRGIIRSEITRITGVFVSDMKIYQKFCTSSQTIDFKSNNVYVLSMDIGQNMELAKIISTYMKLEFESQILSYSSKISPTFFICDEYQEIANEKDARFFSLSREYQCINVISMQSYSSLNNTLKNDSTSRVIIQNLVNKIWFRNDDTYTVGEIIKQIGKEIKKYETVNYSESSQNSKYNFLINNFKNYKSGLSKSISFSQRQEYILNEKYFTQNLDTFESAMIISDGNKMKFIEKVKLKRWDENYRENS